MRGNNDEILAAASAPVDKAERPENAGAATAAPSALNPDILADCGRALYGERWQSELARALGYSYRTMRYWLSGRSPIPSTVRPALLRMLDDHSVVIAAMRKLLAA